LHHDALACMPVDHIWLRPVENLTSAKPLPYSVCGEKGKIPGMRKVMQEVEVAVNEEGQICLRQPGYGHDDGVAIISPDQVDVLTQWLKEANSKAAQVSQQARATRG